MNSTRLFALILMVFPILASALVIDDYAAGAYELGREDLAIPYTVADTQFDATGEHIIGGRRDVSFHKVSGTSTQPYCNCIPDVEYMGEFGFVTYNSAFGCNAVWTSSYGLAEDLNANLTGGDAFELNLISGDLDDSNPQRPVPVTITLISSAGTGSMVQDIVAEGIYSFPFANFAGVDFADVDRITLEIVQSSEINDAVDFALGWLRTNGAVAAGRSNWTDVKKSF